MLWCRHKRNGFRGRKRVKGFWGGANLFSLELARANSQVWRASGASSQWGESYICTEDTLILYKPLVDADSKIRCSFFPEIFISGFFFPNSPFQPDISVCLFVFWLVCRGWRHPESRELYFFVSTHAWLPWKTLKCLVRPILSRFPSTKLVSQSGTVNPILASVRSTAKTQRTGI